MQGRYRGREAVFSVDWKLEGGQVSVDTDGGQAGIWKASYSQGHNYRGQRHSQGTYSVP